MNHRHLALAAICGVCALSAPSRAAAATTTTCDAANPFDSLNDDAALQACLDNFDVVLLKPGNLPGYVGYLIGNQD